MNALGTDTLKNIIDHMASLIAVIDKDARVILANRSALKLIDMNEDDVMGLVFWETPWWATGNRSLTAIRHAFDKALAGNSPSFETVHTKRDGTKVFIRFKLTPVYSTDGSIAYLLAEGDDITDLRDTQRYLIASENRYTSFFEHTRDAIMIISQGRIIDLNDTCIKMFGGESKSQFIDYRPEVFSPHRQPDGSLSEEKGIRMHELAIMNGTNRFEWLHNRMDGIEFFTEVLLTKSIYKNRMVTYAYIHDITEQKNERKRIVEDNQKLVKDIADRNEELKASNEILRLTQLQLIEKEKMATLGNLVAGIAHDISTPLGNTVMAASYLSNEITQLQRLFESGSMSRSKFEHFMRDAKEASQSVLRNIDLASHQMTSFKDIAVNQSNDIAQSIRIHHYLNEIVSTFHSRLKKTNHKIEIEGDPELSFITFPGALSQVIANFISNSLVHGFEGKDGGNIRMEFVLIEGMLSIIYEDDGKGISKDMIDRVFDPYFTTKRGAGGSGLGLHIVQTIVTEVLSGTIAVESEPGIYTRFTCLLPELKPYYETDEVI